MAGEPPAPVWYWAEAPPAYVLAVAEDVVREWHDWRLERDGYLLDDLELVVAHRDHPRWRADPFIVRFLTARVCPPGQPGRAVRTGSATTSVVRAQFGRLVPRWRWFAVGGDTPLEDYPLDEGPELAVLIIHPVTAARTRFAVVVDDRIRRAAPDVAARVDALSERLLEVYPQRAAMAGTPLASADAGLDPAADAEPAAVSPGSGLPPLAEGSHKKKIYDLCRAALDKDGRWPKIKTLAERLVVDERHVSRLLSELRDEERLPDTGRSAKAKKR